MGGTLPDMVKPAAPIAGKAKNTMHDFLFTETCRRLAVLGPAADLPAPARFIPGPSSTPVAASPQSSAAFSPQQF